MLFQFDVSAPRNPVPQEPVPQNVPADPVELLRQILEVQKEQLAFAKHMAMAADAGLRWRTFLSRWAEEFPGLAQACKAVLPQLERAYADLMRELSEKLEDDGPNAIDNEFTLGEFIDRYGMKLGQLGTILNLVTPLAEAAPPPQPPAPAEDNPGDGG